MEVNITLDKIIEDIENLDDNLIIYAMKDPSWEITSPAILVEDSEENDVVEKSTKMSYFLEIYIAKEVLDVWSKWRNGRLPSNEEKFDALVYYAENDAYLE